jgi:hypothetical protein
MIKLIAHKEQKDGFETEVHIEGDGGVIVQQLTCIFDRIYEAAPQVFEAALVMCQYTEDHT